MPKAPKTEFLQIRLTVEDRERIMRIASSDHLEPSTWARRVKTEFLQIRLTVEDRERIMRIASSDHLEPSTWARRVLLKAVEDWEQLNLSNSNEST